MTSIRDPLENLRKALSTLDKNSKVMPASGRAQEDLERPDADELEDRNAMRRAAITDFRENRNRQIYVPLTPIPRTEKHVFQQFIDGCVSSHFLGSMVDGEGESDVRLAQVGAAALHRDERGYLHGPGKHSKFELLLMLDRSMVSDYLWTQLEKTTEGHKCGPFDLRLVDLRIQRKDGEDRKSANQREEWSNKANISMREAEHAILNELLEEIPDGWIVADGGLGSEFTRDPKHGFIGVVKRFSLKVDFRLSGESRSRSLGQILEKLPASARTAAFSRSDGNVAFWYVRLRSQEHMDYPLMGVIKVELAVPQGKELESNLVNFLSSALVAERSVSTFSRDSRWHSHLYPIHCAERAIRARFFTKELLHWGLRWDKIFH